MHVLDSLRALTGPLRAQLTEAQLAVLVRYLVTFRARSGARLVQQGDESGPMFFVVAGEARLERHGIAIGTVGPGDVFGELGLLTSRPRAATVVATSDMELLRLDRDTWQRLLDEAPDVAARVLLGIVGDIGAQLLAVTDSSHLQFDASPNPSGRMIRVEFMRGKTVVREEEVARGTPISALLPEKHDGALVVAALLHNHPVSLSTRLYSESRLEPLTIATREGRELIRHCAGLLLLAAVARVAPERKVRLGPSIGLGRVVHVEGDVQGLAGPLQTTMTKLALERTPFVRELWTVDAARALLASRGHHDAVAALRFARSSTLVMAGIDGVFLPALGPVLPHAEELQGVRLLPHPDGMLLDVSSVLEPFVPGLPHAQAFELEQATPRFGSEMTRAHADWLASMDVTSTGAFNGLCVSGKVKDLIRVAEGFHEKRLGRIADDIAARRGQVKVICIAGPSSSGKTTFIKRLTVQLEVNGVHPLNLSLDDYYVNRERTPRDPNGDYDFEAFDALDAHRFQEHLRQILAGQRVRTAHFDFKSGQGDAHGGPEICLGAHDVLLIEGIHGLNPQLVGSVVAPEQLYRVFVHPATTLRFDVASTLAPPDVRLLRRIVRDRHSRGYHAADTIERWPSVRRGEALHIYPHLHNADAVFDTSVVYELSVLKVYADRYLLEVPQEHPSFPTAYRLRHLLDRFVTIYPDHVPPTSILREFIGGSGFEY